MNPYKGAIPMRHYIINLLLLGLLMIVILPSCGIFEIGDQSETPLTAIEEHPSLVVQILEDNKDKLEDIKNKTANDIELGYATRVAAASEPDDTKLGAKVRDVIAKQVVPEPCKGRPSIIASSILFFASIAILVVCVYGMRSELNRSKKEKGDNNVKDD